MNNTVGNKAPNVRLNDLTHAEMDKLFTLANAKGVSVKTMVAELLSEVLAAK